MSLMLRRRVLETAVSGSNLLSFAGSLKKISGTGSQAITGVGFQPAAVIFFGAGNETDATFGSSLNAVLGFATDAAEGGNSFAQSGGNAARRAANSLVISNSVADVNAAATVTMDADGFTLAWSTGNTFRPYIGWLALGGDGVQAKVGSTTMPSSPGAHAVTGVGFQPSALLMTGTASTSLPAGTSAMNNTLGFASAPDEHFAWGVASSAGGTGRIQTDQAVVNLVSATSSTTIQRAALDSFDSDGFTLDVSVSSAAYVVHYLALSGVTAKVGWFTKSVTVEQQAITGVGFQPTALLMTSGLRPASKFDAWTTWVRQMVGASSGPGDDAGYMAEANPGVAGAAYGAAHIYSEKVAGSNTIHAQADLDSFDSDGFTLDWTVNAPPGGYDHAVAYLALR